MYLKLKRYGNRSFQIIKSKGVYYLLKAIYSKIRYGHIYNFASSEREPFSRSSELTSLPLVDAALVVLAGVPFDDVGGGQRSAQLTRAALKAGRKVVYIYTSRKFDFAANTFVESNIKLPNFTHCFIDDISPKELFGQITASATLLVELPHAKILPFTRIAKARDVNVIFDLIDDWETSLGGDWFKIDVLAEFVETSDVVMGSARVLVDKLREMGRHDALYVPNAANEYIFDKYQKYIRPSDMPFGKHTALYFGSLYGDWFAWDCVCNAARKNPSINFVLIGDVGQKLHCPSNIFFLGSKLIDELPSYLYYTDFAILPFNPGKISDAVSPIKVFEYIFLNKPVLSLKLPEIIDYPGVVIADSAEEFSNKCEEICAKPHNNTLNDIFISKNCWLSRLDTIMSTACSSQKLVSAIILIHNNGSIIERCLSSLIKHGEHFLHEVIVVDNASTDDGPALVQEKFPNVKLVRNPANGCSSGRNAGVEIASGGVLAFFDSDQWFTSASFLIEALSILEKDAGIGAVGWAAGWFDPEDSASSGPIVDYCENRGMNAVAVQKGYRVDIGYLGTGGLFVPASLFKAHLKFDTTYDPTCFEDTDISFQIKDMGLNIAYRDLAGIRHQPHQTTNAGADNEQYLKTFKRNERYFRQKWRHRPQFFTTL